MRDRPHRKGVLLRVRVRHHGCQACRASSSERNLRRPELYVRGRMYGEERERDGLDVK
jgi:hypothetical protein